ncbi:hypothetical protein HZA44_00200 [Candidatus Peregrinibacteria bacterium]|nr:hypothetical protein [Candidatus Peregrinibacteria bacterium]
MAYAQRKSLINKIEEIRGSKVITYVITDKFRSVMIDHEDLRYFYEVLNKGSEKLEHIDLFIYSLGGVSTVAWALINLIRSFTKKFSILVPYNAFSCATSISIGADEIVMGKNAYLGPVDPSVTNIFNPIINNNLAPISVEDIAGFQSLITEKFKISDNEKIGEIFKVLATDIRPLALGNAYRHYLKARDDTKKILKIHYKGKFDGKKIKKISETLIEKLYYHGHHITREEAKNLGLKVSFAENFKKTGGADLNSLMWQLYEDYEKELELRETFQIALPSTGNSNEINIKFIETADISQKKIIEQTFKKLAYPKGSRITINNNMLTVVYPTPGGLNAESPFFEGVLKNLNDEIYEITEKQLWKS